MWWSNNVKPSQRKRAEQRREEARAAVEHLCKIEPRLRVIVEPVGPYRPILTADPFTALVGSIVQQQVSMAAGKAIYTRLKERCPRGRLTPAAITGLHFRSLRSVGLSRQKVRYIRELADHFESGLLNARKLRSMSDEEVVAATTQVTGIGRWTAEMLLIFCLDRPDVWPVDDLGVRKAMQRFLGLQEMPAAKTLLPLADPWRPYRTYATWYLWRSLEGATMPGVAV